jgi:hypothetical protein
VPSTLSVHLNRDGNRSVEPESFAIETEGSFAIELVNHGTPVHVHLHLDDALATVATIRDDNPYVEAGGEHVVRVLVEDSPRPVKGQVEVVTRYGAERANVNVHVIEPRTETKHVAVDEDLGARQPHEEHEPTVADAVGPVVVAVGGVLLAVALTVLVTDAFALTLGALVIVVGVAVAIYVLLN